MILLFLLFTVILALFAGGAEAIATMIAGFVAPILTQIVKKLTGASGPFALILTVLVSAAIAVAAMYMAGEITTFGDVLKQISAVFAIATIVFKLLPPVATSAAKAVS